MKKIMIRIFLQQSLNIGVSRAIPMFILLLVISGCGAAAGRTAGSFADALSTVDVNPTHSSAKALDSMTSSASSLPSATTTTSISGSPEAQPTASTANQSAASSANASSASTANPSAASPANASSDPTANQSAASPANASSDPTAEGAISASQSPDESSHNTTSQTSSSAEAAKPPVPSAAAPSSSPAERPEPSTKPAAKSSDHPVIGWTDFFDDDKQNRPSEHFWDMSEHKQVVEIKGFMGEVLSFEKNWFLLIPKPGAECPFDNGDETYWNKIMIIFVPDSTKLRYTSGPLKITGRLDVGIKVDESGYKTMFRLYDAKVEKIKE